MNIVMTKAALIARLTDRLKLARAEDAEAVRNHRDEEAECLNRFRDALRSALKWDYKTAKKNRFYVRDISDPSCPISEARLIDQELRLVRLDMRKDPFTIQPGTDLFKAVTWLPAAEREKKSICE